MTKKKQILCLGGGGWMMHESPSPLDQYILDLLKPKARPKLCFFSTGSGDSEAVIERFYNSDLAKASEPTHISLFKPPYGRIEDVILSQDIIYVGGGNTRSMLALWREWEVDKALRKAYEAGIVLAGVSAGAICWFDWGLTDSMTGTLNPLRCLGFLKGSCAPHFRQEAGREPKFLENITAGRMPEGFGIDDYAMAHFVDGTLSRVVSSREGSQALFVRADGTLSVLE